MYACKCLGGGGELKLFLPPTCTPPPHQSFSTATVPPLGTIPSPEFSGDSVVPRFILHSDLCLNPVVPKLKEKEDLIF